MLSFIIFALVCAVRAWTVSDYASNSIQHCHLLLVADTFCGSVFPAFVLAFLFAHHVVIFQYDASGFVQSCCVEWFLRRLVLRLFPLPCHVVCHIHLFGRALRLIEQVMRRIPRCQFFRLPTSFAYLILAMVGIGRQFSLSANISKKHLKHTQNNLSQTSQRHWPDFLNISKAQNKLLKHLKDTEQTS